MARNQADLKPGQQRNLPCGPVAVWQQLLSYFVFSNDIYCLGCGLRTPSGSSTCIALRGAHRTLKEWPPIRQLDTLAGRIQTTLIQTERWCRGEVVAAPTKAVSSVHGATPTRSQCEERRCDHATLEALVGDHYIRPQQGCPPGANANPTHHEGAHPLIRSTGKDCVSPEALTCDQYVRPLQVGGVGVPPWTFDHCRAGGQNVTFDARPLQTRFSQGVDHATLDGRACQYSPSDKNALDVGDVTCERALPSSTIQGSSHAGTKVGDH